MKTRFRLFLVWLPLAAFLGQMPPAWPGERPRDLEPALLGRSLPFPPRGEVTGVVVDDGLAVCTLSSGSLSIIDVQDPARPRRRSAIRGANPYVPSKLAMSHRRVFALGQFRADASASGAAAELGVFDLEKPERPVQVGSLELAGYPHDLEVAGSLGFLAYSGHVEVLDLSIDRNPRPIGRYEVTGEVLDVSADGSTACIVERRDPGVLELHILTLDEPAHPQRLGGISTMAGPAASAYGDKVVLRGNRVFLTNTRQDAATGAYLDALVILDIRNPAQPVRVGTLDGGDAYDLAVSGDRVLMGDHNGIQVVSIADETRPTVLGWYETGGLSPMAVSGSTVYLGRRRTAGLQILDLSDPASPRELGSLVTSGRAMDLALVGQHALLAEGPSGLQVLDVSDPADARRVGEYSFGSEVVAVEVGDRVAAVLVWDRSEEGDRVVLEVLDVRALPEAPRLGSYVTDWVASYGAPLLALAGPLAYLAGEDGRDGVRAWVEIVDLTNPALPRRLGGYTWAHSGVPRALAAGGDRLALGCDESVEVLDVSWPASPRLVSSVRIGCCVNGLAFIGPHLLLSGADVGTRVVALADPANPAVLGTCPVGGSLLGVAGSRVYVARAGIHLNALDLSDPTSPREIAGAVTEEPIGAGAALDASQVLVIENEWIPFVSTTTSAVELWRFRQWANPQRTGEFQTRGPASAVVATGGSAWVTSTWWDAEGSGDQGSLERFDLSDPTSPQRVGSVELATPAYGATVAGNRVFVAAGASGLQVFDASTPGNPRRVGGFHNWQANGVAVAGHHAFIADGENGLQVVDVSNPAEPRRVAEYRTSREAAKVAVSDQYAYVAGSWYDKSGLTYRGGFDVVDISDPMKPRLVDRHDSRWSTFGIAVSGGHAYLSKHWWDGQRDRGSLEVVDVADPAKPLQVALVHTARGEAMGVAVSGGHAYVTTQWWSSAGNGTYRGALEVFDVSDPANPRRAGLAVTDQPARGVSVSGRYAYVATLGNSGPEPQQTGLQVFDISDPLNPRWVGGFAGHALDVMVVGSYACVVGGNRFDVLDVSDPADPRRVGGSSTTSAWSVAVAGQRAYLAGGGAGLQIMDLADPAELRRLGGFSAWDARAVAVHGDLAYVADYVAGLRIVDVSEPANLRLIGEHPAGGTAMAVTVEAQNAYLACGEAGLQIFDVSLPTAPRRIGSYTSPGWISSVTLGGTLAYLAGSGWQTLRGSAGLEILDVTDPSSPRRLGGHPTTTPANEVRLSGHYAYVACDSTLEIFDVSDPTRPLRVGGNSVAGGHGLAIVDDQVLVAGEHGLTSLDRFVPLALEFRSWPVNGTRLSVNGPAAWPVRIQRSADLATWHAWQSVTTRGDTTLELTDPDAGEQPRRFYRAVAP